MRLIVPSVFFLLFSFQPAFAAAGDKPASANKLPTSTPGRIAESGACGATVSEALTRVRQKLALQDPASQQQALACLTEIVATMNDKIFELDQAAKRPMTRAHIIESAKLGTQ